MPSTNILGAPVNTSRQAPAGPGRRPCRAARTRRESKRRSTRHQGEICPLCVLMMPFAIPEYLAVKVRRWCRRRLGRKAGNAIGKVVILLVGRPPMIVPRIVFRLARLMQKLLNNLDDFFGWSNPD